MVDRPSANQLQNAARDRVRSKKEIYNAVLDRVYVRIASKAKFQWVRIVYTTPSFMVGVPPYDVQECTRYMARALQKAGYVVEVYGADVLYISWDLAEKNGRYE
jgi:Family of unknown function (DUF5759)